MENQLYTPSHVAGILCIATATLRKWRWEGKGPRFVKIGRKVAYRAADINAFVESQVRRSTSDQGQVTDNAAPGPAVQRPQAFGSNEA